MINIIKTTVAIHHSPNADTWSNK